MRPSSTTARRQYHMSLAMSQTSDQLAAVFAKRREFSSGHEIYGVLEEEVREFFDEVRKQDDVPGRDEAMARELIDIAVVAIRGAAEIRASAELKELTDGKG